MKRSRFTDEPSIAILREQEAGATTADVYRRHGISSATFYAWKANYGGLEVSAARRLKALEDENSKLKPLPADAMLDNAGPKDLLARSSDARRQAGLGRPSQDSVRDERAAGVHPRGGGSHIGPRPILPSGRDRAA